MNRVFNNEKELARYIRDHTTEIFGAEIRWKDDLRNLPGGSGRIFADLVGVDENQTAIIVEVKLLQPRSDRRDNYRNNSARQAVGQVLHYASGYIYEAVNAFPQHVNRRSDVDPTDEDLNQTPLRLFIVGDAFSQPVENMCQFLRAYGINIQHLSVNKQGDPE